MPFATDRGTQPNRTEYTHDRVGFSRFHALDGYGLIRRIRATDSPAGIILLSGFIDCLGMTSQSTGADELINKSNKEVPELLRAVRKLATRPRRKKPGSQGGPSAGRKSVAG